MNRDSLPTHATVRDREGQVATLLKHRDGQATLQLESGETVIVDAGLIAEHGGDYTLPFAFREAAEGAVVPLIEETAEISKRRVPSGGVRLTKTVSEREEIIDEPLLKEDVTVERVTVNRVLEAPVSVRTEGDTTIIPVLEEVLVVEKRLMLKEELHIKRLKTEVSEPQRVTLRSERLEVEELEPERQERD